MSPGDRLPAERDLAKRFDANRATVGRAVALLVSEGLLVRKVGKGTFVANGGEAPRPVRSRSVGMVLHHFSGEFLSRMVRSSVRVLREHSYKAVLFDSEASVFSEAAELGRLSREGLDGALVMPIEKEDNIPLFNGLSRRGMPLVFVDRKPIGLEADLVSSDNFKGAYEATTRLIKRGHKRIAHFTWLVERRGTSIFERRRGYEQALMDNGIGPDPELICPPAEYPEGSRYYKFALGYLRQGPQPVTAVFALHDQFILRTIAAAKSLGLRIPEDIEIAGFFDGAFQPGVEVPIVKVVQRQDEVGRRAAELLMQRIEGNGPAWPHTVLIAPDVVDAPAVD